MAWKTSHSCRALILSDNLLLFLFLLPWFFSVADKQTIELCIYEESSGINHWSLCKGENATFYKYMTNLSVNLFSQYSFTHLPIHSFIHSFIQLNTHSLTHHLFIHSFIHSLTHSHTHSHTHTHTHSLIHSFIHSFIPQSVSQSVSQSVDQSFIYSFIHSFIHPFRRSVS